MTEVEIEKLKSEHATMKKIIQGIQANAGGIFICGTAGLNDQVGLPDMVLVCPKEGMDGFAVYQKVRQYSAPGW